MNRRFLSAMMAIVLGGVVLTGCTSSKENVPVNEEVDVVVEENTTEEEVEATETEEKVTDSETKEESTVESEEAVDRVEDREEIYGEVDPSAAQEMAFVITDGIELPSRVNMDATMFKDTYGIATDHLSSYVVSKPMMKVHATEIAVFEVVDEKGREAVKQGIEKRVKALTEQWQTYLPEQYELVKNYKVVDKDNFVLFVISEEADAIISKFNAA